MTDTRNTAEAKARAALSRLFEPSDAVGLALVAVAGPVDALRIATGAVNSGARICADVRERLQLAGITSRDHALTEALARWTPRIPDLAPERDLATLERLGGALLIPEYDGWPQALADLDLSMPLCLWIRGNVSAGFPELERTVSLVGSRDSTSYGSAVASDLAAGLVQRGFTVASGGAYGIDAQAHRASLATVPEGHPMPTIAFAACGVDRYYPAGNEELLRRIVGHGLLVSEVAPGSSPTRWRFLQRNRLIAALSAATVVVEARWRSGALNTAHHAAGLGRPVGAVPGSVHSANSAGCHRLLRDGSAVCVSDAAEVAELASPIGREMAADPEQARAEHDGLNVEDILLLDALPVRSSSTTDKLAAVAGLSTAGVRAGLGRLELGGLAERTFDGGWRRARSGRG
jgi:DNA processing protein